MANSKHKFIFIAALGDDDDEGPTVHYCAKCGVLKHKFEDGGSEWYVPGDESLLKGYPEGRFNPKKVPPCK